MQKVNSMDTETVLTEITPEPHIKGILFYKLKIRKIILFLFYFF